ncbi:hypothetical protein, partial [Blastococcus sp. CT_GayMR16]|uniref:hypothetical protein n=1 Tax=Blastococcus sp. CT_GayMR16 TaxID=2559607 RepID=UPI001ADDCEC7
MGAGQGAGAPREVFAVATGTPQRDPGDDPASPGRAPRGRGAGDRGIGPDSGPGDGSAGVAPGQVLAL